MESKMKNNIIVEMFGNNKYIISSANSNDIIVTLKIGNKYVVFYHREKPTKYDKNKSTMATWHAASLETVINQANIALTDGGKNNG